MRGNTALFGLLALVMLFVTPTLFAQVTEDWVARYNGAAGGYDEASDVTVDAEGNVYVTGFTDSDNSVDENWDIVTIKYNKLGVAQWTRFYDGPGTGANDEDVAYAIAVDALGNVYVTGKSRGTATDFDYVTIKYEPDGGKKWVARFNGTGSGDDIAKDIAVDSLGNVYVTGETLGGQGSIDYGTIMYDSLGAVVWIAWYDGPLFDSDVAYSLAIDSLGNTHVTGYSFGVGTWFDYATVKYDKLGVQQWVARYDGPAGSGDTGKDVVVDGSGYVYVTGYSQGIGTDSDYATVKYSSFGVVQWVARYNSAANDADYAHYIAVDGSGNVIVTGNSEGSGTGRDYATVKYNPVGVELWAVRYNGSGNSTDYGEALTLDSLGNVYVSGCSARGGSGPGFWDIATIKYNPAGVQEWIMYYDAPWGGTDCGQAIYADDSDHAYVAGFSGGDAITIKYKSCLEGNLCLWARLHGPWNGVEHDCESLMQIDLYDNTMSLVDSFFDVTFDLDGAAHVDLIAEGVAPGNYYVVLRHLNHVDLLTAFLITWDGSTGVIADFTDPVNVECGPSTLYDFGGLWTMPAGDIDPDHRVALSDFNYLRNHWTETDPTCDLDCDGFCRLGDFNKLRQTWNTMGCAP